jgi:lysophospholipid acyltransferase (LPLAT)-like uncharacterized protein
MEWYREQAKDRNDPQVARILEKMGGIDIKGGVNKKDMNQLIEGMGRRRLMIRSK